MMEACWPHNDPRGQRFPPILTLSLLSSSLSRPPSLSPPFFSESPVNCTEFILSQWKGGKSAQQRGLLPPPSLISSPPAQWQAKLQQQSQRKEKEQHKAFLKHPFWNVRIIKHNRKEFQLVFQKWKNIGFRLYSHYGYEIGTRVNEI